MPRRLPSRGERRSCRHRPPLAARIGTGPVGGPPAPDDPPLPTTGRAEGDERCRGCARSGRTIGSVCLQDQQADGVERESTAGMQQAAVADLPQAIGQAMLEESAEKLESVEMGRAWAGTARLTGGEGDGTVREAHDAAVGNGHCEARGGEGVQGGVGVWMGLAVDVPRDGPDLLVNLLSQTGVAHVVLKASAGERGEGVHRDKDVGSRGSPGRAVLCEATARHDGVDVGMVLERSSPGRQDTGETRAVGADEPFVFGEPCEGERRGVEHGLGGEALMGADAGAQGLRDSEGEEDVRPRELCVRVVVEPLLGCMRLALGTVAVATGMIDAVVPPTAWALREAMSIMSALAVVEGTEDLAV